MALRTAFMKVPGLLTRRCGDPELAVQLTEQIERHRPLAPVADLCVMPRPCAKSLIFAGLGTVVTIAVLLVLLKPEEPVAGGKPLGYWFHELPVTRVGPSNTVVTMETLTLYGVFGGTYGSQRVKPSVSTAAIREIGIKGVPFLMAKLSSPSLPFWQQIDRFGFWCGIQRAWFLNREAERAQAVTGLLALPSLPKSTVQELRKLRRKSDPSIAASAGLVLRAQTEQGITQLIEQFQ